MNIPVSLDENEARIAKKYADINNISLEEFIKISVEIIAVLVPVLKLNTSITRLIVVVQELNRRLTDDDIKIENHTHKLENHEVRISRLEEHNKWKMF